MLFSLVGRGFVPAARLSFARLPRVRLRRGHPSARQRRRCDVRFTAINSAIVVWSLFSVAEAARPPTDGGRSLDPTLQVVGRYGVASSGEWGGSDATSTVGGGGFDLNALLGADRYYGHTTPITGQNTITTNLEAGYFWNGHETLQHVLTNSTNFVADTAESWGGASTPDKYDRHATWASMLIGGRSTGGGDALRQQGIAYGTDLRSGAIASSWVGNAYALSFNFSINSFLTPYEQTFGVADVVNSSWGFSDPSGTDDYTIVMDAYSFQNPTTTYVVSAGNTGSAANTVGAPGAGYNAMTVAALTNANTYDVAASFSSRGPQDFGYEDELGNLQITTGVRAAIDIAAPGASLVSAFYGGQNGGNNTTLTGSTDDGTDAAAYSNGIAGTSFSAPLVAGGASLVASAAKTLPTLSANPAARESVVVKALLLNGADKTTGWDNGQQQVTVGSDTFISTTQSLDWVTGTGRMNLDTTFELQTEGQIDVTGTASGDLGDVVKTGWDYGHALLGIDNSYVISEWLRGGTTLTASLTWLRNRAFDSASLLIDDIAQADLNLSVWALDDSDQFTTLIARSESLYNTVEHLSFTLPNSGFYGLRIEYPLNTFDNTTGDVWGNADNPQAYGLSWQAVPEPSGLALAGVAALLLLHRRRGERQKKGADPRRHNRGSATPRSSKAFAEVNRRVGESGADGVRHGGVPAAWSHWAFQRTRGGASPS